MRAAIDLSAEAVKDDAGGPFGAVVVRGDEVVGRGRNRVLVDKDPAAIGFDDEWLYRELGLALESRSLEMSQLMRDEAKAVFDRWRARPDAIIY